jgi:hypothetical protein
MICEFVPIIGSPLETDGPSLRFKGGKIPDTQQSGGERAKMGLYLSNQMFSGGTISARFNFAEVGPASCVEIVVFYDPATSNTLNAGVPAYDFPFLSVRAYESGKWSYIALTGDRMSALQAGKEYHIEVALHGSVISLRCNGVESVKGSLPKQYPPSQVGLFIIGEHDVVISEFSATSRQPRAFIICQYSSPYNEVYMEVIRSVCQALDVEVVRADEAQGPGLIIADVVREIQDSSFVIADITPVNANVFYELGYAHGIRKPAILIAERGTKLPFDVSPFRTLFYDNTIAGKPRLEKGLSEAIRSVLGKAR